MHYTAEHSVENLLFVARNLIKAKASSLQIKRAPPRPLIRMSFSSRNDACAFSLDDCERPCKLSGRGGRHDKIGINSSSGRPKATLAQERHRKSRKCCFRGDTDSKTNAYRYRQMAQRDEKLWIYSAAGWRQRCVRAYFGSRE